MIAARVRFAVWAAAVLLSSAYAVLGGGSNGESPVRVQGGRFHRLGRLEAGTHEIALGLTNVAGRTIHLRSARASCGCTSLDLTLGVFLPQEERPLVARIEVQPNVPKTVEIFLKIEDCGTRFERLSLSFEGTPRGRIVATPDHISVAPQGSELTAPPAVDLLYTVARQGGADSLPWHAEAIPRGVLGVRRIEEHVDSSGRCRARLYVTTGTGTQDQAVLRVTVGAPAVASVDIPVRIERHQAVHVYPQTLDITLPFDVTLPREVAAVAISSIASLRELRAEAPAWMDLMWMGTPDDRRRQLVLVATHRPPFALGSEIVRISGLTAKGHEFRTYVDCAVTNQVEENR